MKKFNIIVFLSFLLFFVACEKDEGMGGKSEIKGTVYYLLTDHNGNVVSKEQAKDERVYIIYGDDDFYGNDVRSYYDGSYCFQHLQKGSYHIYAYEDCSNCESDLSPVMVTAEISKNKETATAPDIELTKYIDIQDGYASISGKIIVKEYNGIGQLLDTYPGAEVRTYIKYNQDSIYFEDMRTDANGMYSFNNLITGDYTIFAYSDCINCGITGEEIKSVSVSITIKNEEKTADDLYIEKRE